MPVYNAGLFLEESLESILNQTFTDFELICVNDDSIDISVEILQKYTDIDDRIIVLTNTFRQGAAESRNRGMRIAEGKYLAFLDADDIFEADMLELAYHTIEKMQADIVMFEYMHMQTEKIYETVERVHSREYRENYCKNVFYLKDCEPYESLKWTAAPWNKLYRRSFIEENRIEFQTLPSSNDVYFVDMALMVKSKLIALDENRVMVHVRNHTTSTRISSNRDPMCCYKAFEKIQKELLARELFEDVYEHFYYRVFSILIAEMKIQKNKEKLQLFYDFLVRKGIKELCERRGVYYEKSDKYIRNAFKKFKDNDFESKWYMQESRLRIFLEKEKESFLHLIKKDIQNGKKICIWGIGDNGRILVNFFNDNKLTIDVVLDTDENKVGKIVKGHRVEHPNYLLDRLNKKYLVIVSSVLAINSANKLEQEYMSDITVVSIFTLLGM